MAENNDSAIPGPRSADDVTRQIHDDLYDSLRAVESSNLAELPAADLAGIAAFSRTVRAMLSVAPVLEGIDDAIVDHCEEIKRLSEGTEHETVANRLAGELKAELTAGDRRSPPETADVGEERIHDGGYNDLELTFERIDTLALAINDAVMMRENRNLVGMVAMIRQHLRDANRIASDNAKRWNS